MCGQNSVPAEDHGRSSFSLDVAAFPRPLHNTNLSGGTTMTVAEARAAEPVAAASVGSVPRDVNFAADVLNRNLDAARATKPAYVDARGTHSYGQLADRVARFGAALRGL